MSMQEKRTITIRQSSLKTFLLCPERFRQKHLGLVDDASSDAALTGTAVHAGIEDTLLGASPDEAVMRALGVLRDGWDEIRKVKTQKLTTAEGHVLNCYSTWYSNIWPELIPATCVEGHFRLPVLETDNYIVELSGTIDYGTEDELGDWKTTGRLDRYQSFPGTGWELNRWDVQSTIYTYAMTMLTGREYNDFTFYALHRTKPEWATLTVQRDETHWSFMLEQVRLMAEAIWTATEDRQWMKNDQSALCSPDWCPAWGDCKGQPVSLPQVPLLSHTP
jgi:hypothetical protein